MDKIQLKKIIKTFKKPIIYFSIFENFNQQFIDKISNSLKIVLILNDIKFILTLFVFDIIENIFYNNIILNLFN